MLKQIILTSLIAASAVAQETTATPDASVPGAAAPAAVPAPAAAAPAPEGDLLFEEMLNMESQLKEMVVSTTRTAIRASQSPAVVTVVTAEEIQTRGLVDLAGVLRTVPGFYDVADLTTHNVGVRGINGGLRASGSMIKVMIDGVAVDFRPTTGNFFGPELIPVEAIARVEIIRGPASALYGANAFLGVVNVITKTGNALVPMISPRVGFIGGNFSAQGTAMAAAHHENIEVLFAAHLAYLDRSGLALPSTTLFGRRRFPLRGYPEGLSSLSGQRFWLSTVQWHFPIVRVQRGWGAIGLQQIHASLFVDSGAAWSTPASRRLHHAIGAELTHELTLGYKLPLDLTIGLAQGLQDSGAGQFYLRLSLSP